MQERECQKLRMEGGGHVILNHQGKETKALILWHSAFFRFSQQEYWSWFAIPSVEPAGLCGRCTGVAVPLRVVPSPTGLPSKRGTSSGPCTSLPCVAAMCNRACLWMCARKARTMASPDTCAGTHIYTLSYTQIHTHGHPHTPRSGQRLPGPEKP